MKTVIYGCSGHYFYALAELARLGLPVDGVAVGAGEDVGRLAASLGKRGFSPAVCGSFTELFDTVKPDVAVINTIFADNTDVALDALGRGISVFIEKPAAVSLEKLGALAEAYKEAKKTYPEIKLAGMLAMRWEATFATAKRLTDEGKIGKIILANGQKSYKMGVRPAFYSARATYGGLIPWVAIHAIDLISWMTGEKYTGVSAVQSRDANRGNGDMETAAAMRFTLSGGAVATVTTDMLRPDDSRTHGDDRLRLVGERGVLEVTGGKLYLNGEEQPLDSEGDIFRDFLEGAIGPEAVFDATRAALFARESADRGGEALTIAD